MRDANGAFGIHSQKSDYISTPFLLISSKPLRNNDSVARDRAVKISSGDNHFAYLNSKNEVHLLGDGSSGQLGPVSRYRSDGGRLGRSYFLQRRRVFIASAKQGRKLLEFEDVWCTPAATFIRVKGEDTWFACGNNRRNQLGVPTLPLAVSLQNFSLGSPHFCGLKVWLSVLMALLKMMKELEYRALDNGLVGLWFLNEAPHPKGQSSEPLVHAMVP